MDFQAKADFHIEYLNFDYYLPGANPKTDTFSRDNETIKLTFFDKKYPGEATVDPDSDISFLGILGASAIVIFVVLLEGIVENVLL